MLSCHFITLVSELKFTISRGLEVTIHTSQKHNFDNIDNNQCTIVWYGNTHTIYFP